MKISILGCGWLGFPLAKHLIKRGHQIKGSTTTQGKLPQLSSEGIQPYLLKLSSNGIEGDMTSFLEGSTILIINIPPRLRNDSAFDYLKSLEHLIHSLKLSTLKGVVLVSSIGVYEDTEEFPEYTESLKLNSQTERAQKLIAAEKLFQKAEGFQSSILRLGGLIGPDRHPVKQLSGRKNILNPQAPVNLIHQQDCIHIIERIIEQESFGKLFNVVFPAHPTKKSYYTKKAEQEGLRPPEFSEEVSIGKIILSSKVVDELGYTFTAGIF